MTPNKRFRLYRDNYLVQSFPTYNDALTYLQEGTSYSWEHAMKHEGWRIEDMKDEPAEGMSEEQEAKAGAALAAALHLRRDASYPNRWQTLWGTKTDLGLWRIISRMVDDARAGKEIEP